MEAPTVPGVSITVDNPPPTTSVLIPSNGATLSGTAATLDASASNATSVKFLLFGGILRLFRSPVICTATLDLLRMGVQLEHHDGTQRLLHPGI